MDPKDSPALRETFYSCKDQIEDGWEILGEGDDGVSYETDLTMFLRGPDGKLYEQEASCCSCYGIDDQWAPVESSVEAIQKTYEAYAKAGYCSQRREAAKAALLAIGAEVPDVKVEE